MGYKGLLASKQVDGGGPLPLCTLLADYFIVLVGWVLSCVRFLRVVTSDGVLLRMCRCLLWFLLLSVTVNCMCRHLY